MERIEHRACAGGWQDVYRHHSTTLGCDMQFAVYLPPQAETHSLPVLYWLKRADLHRAEFHHQGRGAALCGRARRDHRRPGYQSARR